MNLYYTDYTGDILDLIGKFEILLRISSMNISLGAPSFKSKDSIHRVVPRVDTQNENALN